MTENHEFGLDFPEPVLIVLLEAGGGIRVQKMGFVKLGVCFCSCFCGPASRTCPDVEQGTQSWKLGQRFLLGAGP